MTNFLSEIMATAGPSYNTADFVTKSGNHVTLIGIDLRCSKIPNAAVGMEQKYYGSIKLACFNRHLKTEESCEVRDVACSDLLEFRVRGLESSGEGKIEMDELKNKIFQIKEEIYKLKLKVNDLVKREYVQFIPLLQDDKDLTTEAVALHDEMEVLSHKIDSQVKTEVTECLNEIVTLSEAYKESKMMLDVLNKLLYIHGILRSNPDTHYRESRKEAVLKLKEVSEFLDEFSEEFEYLEILTSIKKKIEDQWREYASDNLRVFSEYICWSERDFSIKKYQVILCISEKLKCSDLLIALNNCDELPLLLSHFCDKLLKRILMPIMMSSHSVSISMNKGAQLVVQSEGQVLQQVFEKMENLLKVFQFLSENLNIPVDDEKMFTSKIDDIIAEQFCNLFIKNCVSDSIPLKQKDYECYETFMRQILSFEASLRKMGFLLNKTTALSNFASNADELFSNKTSQVYLSKARDIMKKDLHHMIHVSPQDLTNDSSVSKLNDNSLHQFIDICDNSFQFPACNISKSTAELIELLKAIMVDITESTSVLHAVKLFSAARNIISMYADVVPIYHAKLLRSIPQQAALFFNNCFYLTHMAVFLVFEFKPKFPESLDSHLVTIVDLVQPLRKTGLSILSEQLQNHKKQIIAIIKDSGINTLGSNPVFPISIEKSIRQCLRQLKLLQSVWQQVLPVSMYTKLMKSISSAFIEELIKCILALDDISADVATKLVTIFNIIIEDLPLVFPDSKEVYRLIKQWSKFLELNKILGGTLQQIDERWADGKGPLAEEFKAEQVRHLIRALFRSTERRANILAKIQAQINVN